MKLSSVYIDVNEPSVPILDTYVDSIFGFSTRKIKSSYSGPCMRVVRDSDDAELDIGFRQSLVDVPILMDFIGVFTGRVKTWYSQDGTGRHFSQSDKAKMPFIVEEGVLCRDEVNGSPTLRFLGGQYLELLAANIPLPEVSVFVNGQVASLTASLALFAFNFNANNTDRVYMYNSVRAISGRFNFTGMSVIGGFDNDTLTKVFDVNYDGEEYTISDGDNIATGEVEPLSENIQRLFIGSRKDSIFLRGNISEIICFPQNYKSQRQQIRNNLSRSFKRENFFDYSKALKIFIVAGQSNADGRVLMDAGTGTPDYISRGLLSFPLWDGEKITYYSLRQNGSEVFPNNGSSFVEGTGSDRRWSFGDVALHLINADVGNVLMCKLTNGGSVLAPVANGNGSWSADYGSIPSGTPKLLELLNERFDDLIAFLDAGGFDYTIEGILWHQGEADRSLGTQANYKANFEAMIAEIRSFTGEANLPIFYGTISENSSQYDATINTAQLDVADEDVNAYCRDNAALTLFDGVHFDGASSETFGIWASETYLGL